ncbi:hypothetical protein [Pseudomonas putida]|uniref:hypothetical protein n=1 Tax=Pseudomonas putida TaxID=303 RepID=UPI003D9898CA
MDKFIYDNVVIEFWSRHGEIVSRERRAEPVDFEIEDEYWVRTLEGEELQVVFNNADFRYRKGDQVDLVYAASPSDDDGECALVVNHTLGQSATLLDAEYVGEGRLVPISGGKLIWIGLTMTAVATWLVGAWGLPTGWIFYQLVRAEEARRSKNMIRQLDAHMGMLAESLSRQEKRVDIKGALARNL